MFTTNHHQASTPDSWQLPTPDAEQQRRQRRLTTLFGSAAFILVAAVALALTLAPNIDTDQRGCITDMRPPHVVEFLIDQSDPFPKDLIAFAENEVRRRARTLGLGDLLSVLVLGRGNDGLPLTEAFRRCRPPDGKDVSGFIDNPSIRDGIYVEQFLNPLEDALKHALAPSKANTSPLLETLHAIAQRQAFDAGGQGRSLVIFSDGLQHSSLASFFTRGYSFKQLSQRNSVYLSGLHERFAGICVEMYVVTSKYPRQTGFPEFESFWRDYWLAAGVDCLTFKRI